MSSDQKKRADILLVENGLVRSRSHARDLIKRGLVSLRGKVIKKVGELIPANDIDFEIKAKTTDVGRGADKLRPAIDHLCIDFKGKVVADLGASTGGFSQVCLERGAERIFAVDVGKDQFDSELAKNERITVLEETDVREWLPPELVDYLVSDLSFISLRLCLDQMKKMLVPGGHAIVLWKPQFEMGKSAVNSKGVVHSASKMELAFQEFCHWCQVEIGFDILESFPCQLPGKLGNQEQFLFLRKKI